MLPVQVISKGLGDSNAKLLGSADYKSYKTEQESALGEIEVNPLENNMAVIRVRPLGKNFSGNFMLHLII